MDRDSNGRFIRGHHLGLRFGNGQKSNQNSRFKKGDKPWNAGKKIGIILFKQFINNKDKGQGVKINLSQGKIAFIDEEDWKRTNQHKWCAQKSYNTFYAISNLYENDESGERIKILKMHRFILNAKPGQIIDHINRNGLDNRKSNLRLATNSQNQMNKELFKRTKSGYRGVFPQNGKWRVFISINRKRHNLGYFSTKEEAAQVYNQVAKKHHGEFAIFNVV